MKIDIGALHIDATALEIVTGLLLLFAPSPLKVILKKGSIKGEEETNMDKEFEGSIGPEAKYDIAFKDGVASISVEYQGKYAGASAKVTVPARAIVEPLLQKLKDLIPGQIDDIIIDTLVKSL